MNLIDKLETLGACPEAIAWVKRTTSEPGVAWRKCERADWLLWFAAKLGVSRKLVVLATCQCARTALQYVPDGETRPLTAIETAEAWALGEASLADVHAAADAATAAAYAADDYAAADGANAAAHGADGTDGATAATAAAYAANDAAYAAADATADDYTPAAADTRNDALRKMADLVREVIPWNVVAKATGSES